jgi:hypothetical protein
LLIAYISFQREKGFSATEEITDKLKCVSLCGVEHIGRQIVSTLFSQSNGEQKAGVLNHLLGSVGPGTLAQLAGGGALASLLAGGAKQITPDQAQNISPEMVQQLATHAEKADPSIVDKASAFYAQHTTLIKTLGGTALSIALAKVAEQQRAA